MLPLKLLILMLFACVVCIAETIPVSEPDEALRAVELLRTLSTSDPEAITRAFEQLIQTHPKHPGIRVAYGDHLFELTNQPAALLQWNTALALAPEYPDALSRLAGFFLNYKGDAPKAAEYFARAVAAAPKDAAHHRDLGNVLALFRHELHGKFGADSEAVLAQSLVHFKKATEIEPQNIEAARGYAETFYMQENPDWTAARAAWEHATNLMPAKDFGWLNLARVSLKLGDKTAAFEYLAKVENARFHTVRDKLRIKAEE